MNLFVVVLQYVRPSRLGASRDRASEHWAVSTVSNSSPKYIALIRKEINMEETSIVKEEMQEEIEMEMDEEMDEEIEEEENEEEELKEMEETTTVVPKITIVVDMSMQVMALKAKLGRRNTILEVMLYNRTD